MAPFCRLVLPISEHHGDGVIQRASLCPSGCSFSSVMSLRVIQDAACWSSFLFAAERSPSCDYGSGRVTCPWVSRSPAGSGLFWALRSVGTAVWAFLLVSLDDRSDQYAPSLCSSRNAGLQAHLWLTGYWETVSQSRWASLHSHQQLLWARMAPHSADTSHCDFLPLVSLRVSQFNFHLRFLSRAMVFITFPCVYWLIE